MKNSFRFAYLSRFLSILLITITTAIFVNAQVVDAESKNLGGQCNQITGTVPFADAQATVPAQGGIVQFYNTPENCEFEYEAGGGIVTGYSQRNGRLIETDIDKNPTNSSRSGTLIAEGMNYAFTVNQTADDCTYTLDQGRITVLNDEGSGSFSMTTQPGCEWQAYAADTKIGLNGQAPLTIIEGTGSATIDFEVEANNTGRSRELSIIIAGLKQEILQAERVCELSNPRNFFYAPKEGKTFTFTVELTEGCNWNAYQTAPEVDWITLIEGENIDGLIEIQIIVAPNNNNETREKLLVFASFDSFESEDYIIRQDGQQEAAKVDYDFENSKLLDPAVFRPTDRNWYINYPDDTFVWNFGLEADKIVPADYNGDGRTDIAVFRPSTGVWYIQFIEINFFGDVISSTKTVQFGLSEDIPVPGDFDGDGKADIRVYRPSTGIWYGLKSSNDEFTTTRFGLAEDKPMRGDFDGDGKADVAVWRPSNGVWYVLNSSDGSINYRQFGLADDIPVPADYDFDNKTDIAVYRASEGIWYRLNSSNGGGFEAIRFGLSEDIPIPADYDADGRTDIAVFRPSEGVWYLLKSTEGFAAFQYGINGDIPIPAAFNQ